MRPPQPTRRKRDAEAGSAPAGGSGTATRILLLAAVMGIVARIVLAAVSCGTNDNRFYKMFAQTLVLSGMGTALEGYEEFNLTPAMSGYAVLVLLASHSVNLSYPLLFKLPLVAADAASMVLLWKIWRRRSGTKVAALAAALYAWSLTAILISGYHCNTDPFYAFLALLAVFLAEERQRPGAAGLTLGAAVNVKLIPVIFIPSLLARCRGRSELIRCLAALAVCAAPFLVMLLIYRGVFYQKVIDYDSHPARWGIGFFLRQATEIPAIADAAHGVLDQYRAWGKYVMLIAIALAALDGRRRGWDGYRSAAVAGALFLILAPGFGLQYMVVVVPLLFAVSLRFATVYSLAAGAFLLTLYVRFSRGTFPWETFFPGAEPLGPALVGLVPWGVLLAFVMRSWMMPTSAAGDGPPDERG